MFLIVLGVFLANSYIQNISLKFSYKYIFIHLSFKYIHILTSVTGHLSSSPILPHIQLSQRDLLA